ncbi:MAG: alpha/beta hydrolase [Butyrivibrio sp.]|jgi:acetyl esterase/lipase|nr:alpha/beta hydrolase [Butyrivibrio sp.]
MVLIGVLYLLTGILQQFLVNKLFLTATIAIAVSILGIVLKKDNKRLCVVFLVVAILNCTGYFFDRFTWLSILGIISYSIGIIFTVIGFIDLCKKKSNVILMILLAMFGCALVFAGGFLSLTSIKPEMTMSVFASVIMGSDPENITEAEQKQSTLEDGTVLISDIQYDTEDPNGFLDIYYTTNADSETAPTFLFIHGGGYAWGDKVAGDPNMAKAGPTDLITTNVLSEGYNVVQINYALAPEYKFPVAIKQLNRGLDFLVQHGEEYGLDMSRLVISGGSAGGNLAGLLVNIQTNPEYAALIDESAVIDPDCIKGIYFLAALFDNSKFGCTGDVAVDWMFTQLGRLYLETNELKTDSEVVMPTNVTEYITENFPPAFISDGNSGTFDAQAYEVYEKLMVLGVDTQISYFPAYEAKLGHGHEGNDTKYSRIMYTELFKFLDKCLND